MLQRDPMDAKGLIFESYQIDGITTPECRSIFLDWAISVPEGVESADWIRALLDRFQSKNADHPMTQVLREALEAAPRPKRRGGARGRRG